MLMFHKKRLRIAKMLARAMYRLESNLEIPQETFTDINEILIDIADEVGGISLLSYVGDCLDKIRKGGGG